jgi:hypothetical protein
MNEINLEPLERKQTHTFMKSEQKHTHTKLKFLNKREETTKNKIHTHTC